MNTPNAARHYFEKQILNSTPAERVVLLYDGAIRALNDAKKAITEKRIQDRCNANQKAKEIIGHLADTLDMIKGGDIARSLDRLYKHMLVRLMDVDFKNDAAAAEEVINHLRPLRESWAKLAQGQKQEGAQAATGTADTTPHQPTDAVV